VHEIAAALPVGVEGKVGVIDVAAVIRYENDDRSVSEPAPLETVQTRPTLSSKL